VRSVSSRQVGSLSSRAESQPSYLQPSKRLKGSTCMITGGSSGIGLAIAQRFLCEGAERIIIVGTNKMRLFRALEQLRSLDASLWSGKEDGMPSESIDKATAENRSNAPDQEDPLQQQPLQIDGSGQALSQQLSSPARNSD